MTFHLLFEIIKQVIKHFFAYGVELHFFVTLDILFLFAKRAGTKNGENERDEIHALAKENTEKKKEGVLARLLRLCGRK